MSSRSCLAIILAAGDGTRMRSKRSKVLHEVAGLPLVGHVVRAATEAGSERIALVVGRDAPNVADTARRFAPDLTVHQQTERLGTGHAVLAARSALSDTPDDVLILFGDTPLVTASDLAVARNAIAEGAAVAVMGFYTDNPYGYGRLIEEKGQLVAIREQSEASFAEQQIQFCNGGLMALSGEHAERLLDGIGNDNAKGEYYLTDIVEIARAESLSVVAREIEFESVLGINTRSELAHAEQIWQQNRRRTMMDEGVTLLAPSTVSFAYDTEIGADTVIEPNVIFGPGVSVGVDVRIHGFSHLEGATIADGAQIGPFARLRPGAELGAGSKVGNFCEIKQASLGEGAKVNHLSYIGDATIGAKANIGAGTVTCNYDGYGKHRTEIGDGAFVGTHSSLVAPVRVGANAYVGTGSVITEDVPADALALGRARQVNKEGRGAELRQRLADLKAAKSTS